MTTKHPRSSAGSAQIVLRWLLVATLAWVIGSLLIVQIRAPFTLRSMEGWNDVVTHLSWSVPFEVAPLGIVVVGWITLVRTSARIRSNWVGHTLSVAAMVPVLLAVDLLVGGIFLLLVGVEPTPTPGALIAAWMEPGQPLEWVITNMPMIVVPRIALDRRLRYSGLIDYR